MTVQCVQPTRTAAFSFLSESYADIFVFNDDGLQRLDTYQRMKIKDGKVSAVTTGGPKIIAVIVDPSKDRYDWTSIDSYSALCRVRSDIREEDPDCPVMSGVVRTAGKTDVNCEMDLEPLLSRISLRSISCDFLGKPYENESLTDGKVYLTNVTASWRMMDSDGASVVETVNTAGLNSSDLASLKSPGMLSASLPSPVPVKAVRTDIDMWCYPNTCEEETLGSRFTRLVIEGKVNGMTYWWPIDINREDFGPVQGTAGISRNCSYVFDVTLTRTGSSDPDTPVSAADVRLTCNVVPWTEKKSTVEEF